jgi:hypothetical protein
LGFLLLVLVIGLTAGVTGQQGMLTPPWHLIPSLVFPAVCVSQMLPLIISLPEMDTDFDRGFFR